MTLQYGTYRIKLPHNQTGNVLGNPNGVVALAGVLGVDTHRIHSQGNGVFTADEAVLAHLDVETYIHIDEVAKIKAEQEKARLAAEAEAAEKAVAEAESQKAKEVLAAAKTKNAIPYKEYAGKFQKGAGYAMPAASGVKTINSLRKGEWGNAAENAKDTGWGLYMARMHQTVPATVKQGTKAIVSIANLGKDAKTVSSMSRGYGRLAGRVAEQYLSPIGKALVIEHALEATYEACKDGWSWRCGVTSVTQTIDAAGSALPNPLIALALNGTASLINWAAGNDVPTFFESVTSAVGSAASGETTPSGTHAPSGAGQH